MSFVVRNGKDPMILAKQLSGETFDFGLASDDLFVLGILGVVISMLMMVRPCVVLCAIRRIPNFSEYVKQGRDDVYNPQSDRVRQRANQYFAYEDVPSNTEGMSQTEQDNDEEDHEYMGQGFDGDGQNDLHPKFRSGYAPESQSRSRPLQHINSGRRSSRDQNLTMNASQSSAANLAAVARHSRHSSASSRYEENSNSVTSFTVP